MSWLYDGDYWTTRDGSRLPIDQMDPTHARNAKNYMLRSARRYVTGLAFKSGLDAALHDGGDMAQNTLEGIADELCDASLTVKGSVDVIKRTPVFRALKRRARRAS